MSYDPLTATNAELRAHGERQISDRRESVRKAGEEVRQTISDLIDENERLKREVRSLQVIVHHQVKLLDRAEPARVTYFKQEGATQ